MKQEFIELMSILLGQKAVGSIADYKYELNNLSQDFNDALKVRSEQTRFHKEMEYEENTYFIPPVPYASTNENDEPVSFAFLGLNPKLFLNNDNTIQEKKDAGKSWEEYADFYTTINRKEHDIGKFYRNLTIIMESLKSGNVVRCSEFIAGCENRREKLARFIGSIEKDPLLVGELIPLHSSRMGALDQKKIRELFGQVNQYEPYLRMLFMVIFNKLKQDGWLIANGKGSSAAIELFIKEQKIKGNFHKILDKSSEKYTCYVWEHEGNYRKVLLLHQFLFTAGGAFNGYDLIDNMVHNVLDAFEKWKMVEA